MRGLLRSLPKDKDENKDNFRQAFLLGVNTPHATPIIYIKEGKQELILIADSLGPNIKYASDMRKLFPDVPIAMTGKKRQADYLSCYVDAIIIARDTTALNRNSFSVGSQERSYKIPNLISLLNSKKPEYIDEKNKINYIDLPAELLKTSQLSAARILKEEEKTKKIHKQETLDSFLKSKNEEVEFKKFDPTEILTFKKIVNSYLRKKGIQLADMMEIQFYLHAIETQLNRPLLQKVREEFIYQAKIQLHEQGPPINLLMLITVSELISALGCMILLRDF